MSLNQIKSVNGGNAARATNRVDSIGNIHVHEHGVGTVQGDPVVIARLEGLESQLAQVTKLLMGLSSSMGETVTPRHLVRGRTSIVHVAHHSGGMQFPILLTQGSYQQLPLV